VRLGIMEMVAASDSAQVVAKSTAVGSGSTWARNFGGRGATRMGKTDLSRRVDRRGGAGFVNRATDATNRATDGQRRLPVVDGIRKD
jgi:hypothetical protein